MEFYEAWGEKVPYGKVSIGELCWLVRLRIPGNDQHTGAPNLKHRGHGEPRRFHGAKSF